MPSSTSITAVPVQRARFSPTSALYEICATTFSPCATRSSTISVMFPLNAARRDSAISMYASTPGVGLGCDGSIKMWSSEMNCNAAARALSASFWFHTSRYSFRTTALFLLGDTSPALGDPSAPPLSLTAASATPADASAVTTLSNMRRVRRGRVPETTRGANGRPAVSELLTGDGATRRGRR